MKIAVVAVALCLVATPAALAEHTKDKATSHGKHATTKMAKPVEAKSNSKPVVYVGEVTMVKDRSLSLFLHGTGKSHAMTRTTLQPADKDYKDILSRVGGLRPGETKPLPQD